MASELRLRRGSTASHAVFTGAAGELTFDTERKVPVAHDGATAGGFPVDFDTHVVRYGAVSGGSVDCSAAFQAAGNACPIVHVSGGTFKVNTAPTFNSPVLFIIHADAILTGAGATAMGYTSSAREQMLNVKTANNDFATKYIRREAKHTGGTPGFVSCGLRVDTYVGPGATNFEWAILGRVYNEAAGGENVGVYGQGVKAANGPTWGMVAEGRDVTNTANPTSGLLGIEVDVFANGTDTNNNRIGVDIVTGQALTGGGYSACNAYAGIRVSGRNVAGDVGSFYNGLVVNSATYAGVLLGNTGTFGIAFTTDASVQVGADFSSGTFAHSAMRFARQQNIALEGTGTVKLQTLGASDDRLRFINGSTEVLGINISSLTSLSRLVVSGTCASGLDLTGGTYSTAGIRVPRAATLFTLEETNTIKVQSLGAFDARLRFIHTASEVLGINIENNNATARLVVSGTCAHGVDFSGATIGTTALKMARGQGFSWEATNTITQALDSSVDVIRFNRSGTEKVSFVVSSTDANNGIRINGTGVVGPRKTGWAGPTGTAARTAFDTATVTLADLAQRVKALLDDLISHGLIGA